MGSVWPAADWQPRRGQAGSTSEQAGSRSTAAEPRQPLTTPECIHPGDSAGHHPLAPHPPLTRIPAGRQHLHQVLLVPCPHACHAPRHYRRRDERRVAGRRRCHRVHQAPHLQRILALGGGAHVHIKPGGVHWGGGGRGEGRAARRGQRAGIGWHVRSCTGSRSQHGGAAAPKRRLARAVDTWLKGEVTLVSPALPSRSTSPSPATPPAPHLNLTLPVAAMSSCPHSHCRSALQPSRGRTMTLVSFLPGRMRVKKAEGKPPGPGRRTTGRDTLVPSLRFAASQLHCQGEGGGG